MIDNQGFRPKSEISAQERAGFESYRAELLALPPANCEENAIKIRAFWAKHLPSTRDHFDQLGLEY